MFFAHLLIMGLVKKPKIIRYWARSEYVSTPFFGKYMTRTRFELIMTQLHLNRNLADDKKNALFKLQPFIDMCQKNFRSLYEPSQNLSLDEACCPFKGRLKFKVYNKSKPSKFHIKLYQVCEAETGYVSGFEVYTGKDTSQCIREAQVFDPKCCKTTKLVVGLMQKLKFPDKGHHLYMDNYYNNLDLSRELFARNVYMAGTVWKNRKGLPLAVKEAKLKQGECVFRRNDDCLVLKWCDKRPVLLLSTIHDAVDVITDKKDLNGFPIVKPKVVHDYVRYMRGCDVSNQLVTSYTILRCSVKWWRKLLFHLFSVLVNNAYVLYKKFGSKPMQHEVFIEHIVEYLVTKGLKTTTCIPVRKRGLAIAANPGQCRLSERHFPSHIPPDEKIKRAKPSKVCHACNFGKKEVEKLGYKGVKIPRKLTSYECPSCQQPLCIEPCFQVYHTVYGLP